MMSSNFSGYHFYFKLKVKKQNPKIIQFYAFWLLAPIFWNRNLAEMQISLNFHIFLPNFKSIYGWTILPFQE